MMNRCFFQVFTFLAIQIVMIGSVFAQSSLTLPEQVDIGQSFTITWPATDEADLDLSEEESFEGESYRLQRFDTSSNSWVTIFESDFSLSHVENLIEAGTYEYRLVRDIVTSENEEDGDNISESTETEPSISVVVGVLTPATPTPTPTSTPTPPESLSSLILPEMVAPNEDFTISWPATDEADLDLSEEESFEGESYTLQRFETSSNSWVTIFESDFSLSHVESLTEAGTYEYRLVRDIVTSENEDDGDNISESTETEPSISLIVSALIAPSNLPHSYHFVNASHEGDSPKIYALADDTEILWQNAYYQIDAGEMFNIGTVSQGDFIESNQPLSIGSTKNGVDMPVPIEFSGSEFVMTLTRYTHHIYVKNINDTAVDVEFFDGNTYSTSTIPANEIVRFESTFNNTTASLRALDQSLQLLVSHGTSNANDTYSVPPATPELFGVRNGSFGAIYDNTTVTQYTDNGGIFEHTLNAGDRALVFGSTGSQSSGSFVRLVADKPIGASQIADGDGGEQTAFITQSMFARKYILPTDTQYIAMGCFGMNSTISIYDPSGALLASTTCSSSNASPGKAYLGSTSNGTQFSAGSRIESTEPIYLIYETSTTNDEHNLIGEG